MVEPKRFLPIFLNSLYTEFPSTRGTGLFNYNENLFLFIEGGSTPISDNIDLFLHNDGADAGLSLFIQGQSITGPGAPGHIPYNETLFLFIGTPRLITEDIKLFLKSVIGIPSGDMDAFIQGSISPTGGIQLVMPEVLGEKSNNISFYVHGF